MPMKKSPVGLHWIRGFCLSIYFILDAYIGFCYLSSAKRWWRNKKDTFCYGIDIAEQKTKNARHVDHHHRYQRDFWSCTLLVSYCSWLIRRECSQRVRGSRTLYKFKTGRTMKKVNGKKSGIENYTFLLRYCEYSYCPFVYNNVFNENTHTHTIFWPFHVGFCLSLCNYKGGNWYFCWVKRNVKNAVLH